MSNLTSTSPEILTFIAAIQARKNEDFAKNFKNLTPDVYLCERGTKFLAIDHITDGGKGQRMVYCFIAACDSESKTLGVVKKGDILKAASYKAPAKHVRGSIYNVNPLKGTGLYGVDYLK